MSVSWARGASCFASGTRALFHQRACLLTTKVGKVDLVGISHIQAVGSQQKNCGGQAAMQFSLQDGSARCGKLLKSLHLNQQELETQRDFYFNLLTSPAEHININAHEDPAFIAGRLAETRRELDQTVRDIASLNKCMKYFTLQKKLQAMEGRVISVIDRVDQRSGK